MKSIEKIVLHPRILFLIDGAGALLSAFLLGIVLARLESIFGMPRKALYFLAIWPCLFAVYDFLVYVRRPTNWAPFLKVIAIANLLYCGLSLGFVFHHFSELTHWGLIYFFGEIAIVGGLVYVELKTAAELTGGRGSKPQNRKI